MWKQKYSCFECHKTDVKNEVNLVFKINGKLFTDWVKYYYMCVGFMN